MEYQNNKVLFCTVFLGVKLEMYAQLRMCVFDYQKRNEGV